MADQKTAQQQTREQFRVAENAFQGALRTWNDMLVATTDMAFDSFNRNLHYSQEARTQTERVMQQALATYRSIYQDNLKHWQGYIQSLNDVMTR